MNIYTLHILISIRCTDALYILCKSWKNMQKNVLNRNISYYVQLF